MHTDEYKITNIINYLRKSRQDIEREKRTGEDTLSQQKKLMDRVLNDLGIPYVQKSEIGSGDKIETRPVFQEILEEIKEGKYDAIAVKELSRLGRGSYKDMGIIFDLLEERRLYIITPYKTYDITNPSDKRQIRFELFLSREEFETIRERLTGARYNLAMEGKWVAGSAPFGYQYNKKTQRLEPHPEQKKVIQLIYDIYVNGLDMGDGTKKDVSFKAIATYLTRLGYKSPNGKDQWSYLAVQRALTNTTYIGQVKFRTTQRKNVKEIVERPEDEHIIVDDAHEALVSLEMWDKAQEKYMGRNKTHNTKLDFSPCELAGLGRCAVCGKSMVRNYSVQHYKKQNGEKSTYRKEFLWCTTPSCTYLKYRDVEEAIINYLGYLQALDEDLLAKHIAESIKQEADSTISVNDLKRQVEERKAELKKRLDFVYQKHESGVYDDDEFVERRSKIKKELDELNKVKFKEEEQLDENEIDVEKVKENVKSILDAYKKLENKTNKNKLLHLVFDHITLEITEKGRGRRSAKFKMTPVLKQDLVNKNLLV